MHIVIDTALNNGTAEYRNMGDVAMLQVAVKRLKELWPSSCLQVITESPLDLSIYCPEAKPLPRKGRDLWIGDIDSLKSFLFTRYHKFIPNFISKSLIGFIRLLEYYFPLLIRILIRLRPIFQDRGKGDIRGELIAFLKAIENTDLLVVCGAGGFADSTRGWNWTILNTLEDAVHRNIPVIMFGQGMGPLNDPLVLSKSKIVLPAVSLITLRGGRGGLALLKSIGVNPSVVLTTGDEAIELAYEAKPAVIGDALGINLRIASNVEVEERFIEIIRPVLQVFARRHNVPILPVPIAVHQWADDSLTIRKLLKGFDDDSDGGVTLDTPRKVIEQAGRCRVVVTGAYHAAVFALAQGVPVVCLSKSPYYDAKFLGLEDQFGLGCETVFLNDPNLFEKLPAALERAWQSAEIVRLPLQQAALRQIELSQRAYKEARNLLDSNNNSIARSGICRES